MEGRAGGSSPPDRSDQGAHDEFSPYPRNPNHQALKAIAPDLAFGGVGVKRRGQKDKKESHRWHSRAIVFAGQTVTDFVKAQQHGADHPEGRHVQPGLIGEVIELQRVMPDLAPVTGEDPARKGKDHEGEHGKPRRVHKADAPVHPSQEPVWIDGGERDLRKVTPPVLFLLQPTSLVDVSLHQLDVLFLRSLVPEINRLNLRCEVSHRVHGIRRARLLGQNFCHILVGALAIEKLDQVPGLRRKGEHCVHARNKSPDHILSVFNVFSGNDLRMHARIALAHQLRG